MLGDSGSSTLEYQEDQRKHNDGARDEYDNPVTLLPDDQLGTFQASLLERTGN
jgi:hypothetical protein